MTLYDPCPNYSLFHVSYSDDLIATFNEILFTSYEFYYNIVPYFAPVNIAANLFAALLLLLMKELRNPFNLILSIMCLSSILPLIIRVSLVYRKMMVNGICNVETQTYSIAVHTLLEVNTWAAFRSFYTWMDVVLTALRFRALRFKGKWEPSYALALSATALVAVISTAADIPVYFTNVIMSFPVDQVCGGNPDVVGNQELVPATGWSDSMFSDNCLLYQQYQWISGIIHNTLPALLLLIFTLLLIFEILRAHNSHMAVAARSAKKSDDARNAAIILTIIALLTLLSELPQGFACLANAVFPVGFWYMYTYKLYMLWMIIQIFSTSCNLIITLVMSNNFRKAARGMIFCRKKNNTSSPTVSVISGTKIASLKN
ncbi:hypothetical protein PRIPAC_91626 [Pristionchus pacificus]|uniref:G_PROTEIN_RECEP_F1_2 domain-containing protein n=1 Tax=Pristionchus pacificus TaxID=54126 RepID=A0A2A6BQT7_PRIPA|nr:hypothetical protein PRIPAC_91626 [Pristionchus pacificus]|eukprot:PDM68312.1 hypothetical protein PRIPAC_46356 [Pristionchus pacificus]